MDQSEQVTTASVSPDQPGVILTTEPAGESKPVRRRRTVTVPQELIVAEQRERDSDTPTSLVRIAVEQGLDIDRLEKLLALQREWEAGEARKSFFDALSKFQSEIPPIVRADNVDAGRGGKRRYASLGTINEAIRPWLYANGLSFRFRQQQGPVGITVTCVVSHRDGHSEETTLTAGADSSGAKNAIQSVGSTITYLERYTLTAALGLTTVDDDDDGADSGPALTLEQQRQNALDLARAAAAGQPATEAPRKPAGKEVVADQQAAPPAQVQSQPQPQAVKPITPEQTREMVGLMRDLFKTGAEAQTWLLEHFDTNNPSLLTETEAMGVLSALLKIKHEVSQPAPLPPPPAEQTDGRATPEQRQAIRELTTTLFGDRAVEEQTNWLRSLGYSSVQSCTQLEAAERIAFLDGQMHPKSADADIPF